MLNIDLLDKDQVDRAAGIFHRDGFVAIKNALAPPQLAFAQQSVSEVIKEQTDADPQRVGNRGSYRYSIPNQGHREAWTMLFDLPWALALLERIWNSRDFIAVGAGGDYSLPGAQVQVLHSDIAEFLHDPLGLASSRDLPAPFIVINYLMVDFTKENGAVRFVPGTQRARATVPSLADEPRWMRDSIICAPAGTALVRDVRCWHGGTANTSTQTRPMTSAGYYAPWYTSQLPYGHIKKELRQKLSPRGQEISRYMIEE